MIYCTCHYYNLGLVQIWYSSCDGILFLEFSGQLRCESQIGYGSITVHHHITSLNCKPVIFQVYWLLKQANIERVENIRCCATEVYDGH